MAENEMVGWHYHLHVQEFEQTPGDGEGQGSWCASEAERRLLLLSQTRWHFRLGTEELFSVSHLSPFLPDRQGSRPVLLPQSSTWTQGCPHRSPQDFVHTCLLRLFTALPRPLSNHSIPRSVLSISPISGTTESSWDPGSEDSMYVCYDVFFI